MSLHDRVMPAPDPSSDASPQDLPHAAQVDQALPHALDDPEQWPAFGTQQDGVWVSQLVVDGMHCAACAHTVAQALERLPSVQAQVSAAAQRVQITWDPRLTRPSQWQGVLSPLGYGLRPAFDASLRAQRKRESRRMLWRLLVACLAMMQVMMYAWPEYVAAEDLSAESRHLLRWASWVITLPVMLFSAGPFFSAAWRDIRHRHISMDLPVALGMAITFTVSTLATFNPQGVLGSEVYFDSLTMFVFFLLGGRWLELRLRDRTAGALDALLNRVPQQVWRRCEDLSFERVAVRQLQVGDVLRVHSGEAFAADGLLLQGSTWVDEAILTGESRPLAREPGQGVLAGSHNLGSSVLVCVTQLGADTRYAGIVALMAQAASSKPQLAQLVDRIAKPFLVGVLLAAALAALWWWPSSPGHALMVAAAVLIVTCPCALSLATPVSALTAAGQLARHGVLVNKLSALETLAEVDTVVFDKTGTLSQDHLVIQGIETRAGTTPQQALALAAALAQHALHPVSRALVHAAQAQGLLLPESAQVHEQSGAGLAGLVGTPSQALRLGHAAWCGVPARDALLGQVHLSDAQGWVATFAWGEALREDAKDTVAALAQAGVAVHILSGDQPEAVARLAAQLGITHAQGGCSPQDKLQAVQQLQAAGRRVAMVGDGVNDGPVLAAAHVAIALGQGAVLAQARAPADLVIMGELGGVARALQLARQTRRVVRQNLFWALAYNLACVPLALMGYLPAWLAGLGMAASSLGVVLNAARLNGSRAAAKGV